MGESYREALRLQRRNHKIRPRVKNDPEAVQAQARESLRAAYFKAKSKGYSTAPAWRKLDGF